jgi:hypothetical protein
MLISHIVLKHRKASGMVSPFGVPPTTSTPSKTLLWGATGEKFNIIILIEN